MSPSQILSMTVQEFPLSLLLPAVHTEPPAFTTACAEFCVIMGHNKEHKEHCPFFADSIQLYVYKTGVSVQCLKEVVEFCSTLYVFCLNMTSNRQCPKAVIQ